MPKAVGVNYYHFDLQKRRNRQFWFLLIHKRMTYGWTKFCGSTFFWQSSSNFCGSTFFCHQGSPNFVDPQNFVIFKFTILWIHKKMKKTRKSKFYGFTRCWCFDFRNFVGLQTSYHHWSDNTIPETSDFCMLLHSPLHHFAPQKANSDLINHGWFQFWFTYDRCFGVSNQACHASCACATVAVMPPARKTWAPCAVPDLFNPCWSAWNQIVYQHSMRFVGANHHPESKLFCGTIEGVLHLACILCLCRSTKLT